MANREYIEQVLMKGTEVLANKLEILVNKKEFDMNELGCIADLMKDASSVYKNVAKAHAIYDHHSPEKI